MSFRLVIWYWTSYLFNEARVLRIDWNFFTIRHFKSSMALRWKKKKDSDRENLSQVEESLAFSSCTLGVATFPTIPQELGKPFAWETKVGCMKDGPPSLVTNFWWKGHRSPSWVNFSLRL